MKLYLTTFVLVTVGVGVFYHSVTIYPMPWWPDTLIMGLPFGALAVGGAWQHRRTNRMIWNALKGAFRVRGARNGLAQVPLYRPSSMQHDSAPAVQWSASWTNDSSGGRGQARYGRVSDPAFPASLSSPRRSKTYSAMFSAFAAGAFLAVTGSIGWDVSHLHGLFRGGRWAEGPIWWQITLGALLLLLGAYLFRRLGEPGWTSTDIPRDRIVKNVGRGKTSSTDQKQERRRLGSGEPQA